ncbi:MAG: molybdopterin-guanine dinucleotide biosynthesis protein MobB [Desulfurococcaceae archaeon]
MLRYVIRFISLKSGKGKTYIASKVISKLRSMGYSVSAIKHATHKVELENKDSHVYVNEGADPVILSSSDIGVIYRRKWIDSLEYALSFTDTPIIVVEGFKHSKVGDIVAIADSQEEVAELERILGDTVIAVVTNNPQELDLDNKKVFGKDDVDSIVDFVRKRAVEHIAGNLPGRNCGACGFTTCRLFAEAYLRDPSIKCPMELQVKLIINNTEIALNPFVKNMLRSILEGFIKPLKDVPKSIDSLIVEIRY